MSISILKPGLLTTVQDLGRRGHQREGVPVSGAMDARALRVANLLVGNAEGAAALECASIGPHIRFEADHLIALTGADLGATLNGLPLKQGRPVAVGAGCVLKLGAARAGAWAYLAVAGGLAVPAVLGSSATYLRAGLGGHEGRALKTGDRIECATPTDTGHQLWQQLATTGAGWAPAGWAPAAALYGAGASHTIRVLQGPEYEQFTAESQQAFWSQEFTLTPASDRMGARLQGPALVRSTTAEVLSSAVTFGTVQVPAAGQPMVLLADHQTTGGYPRIGQVISADLHRLVQVPLGRNVRFQETSLQDAQYLLLQQENAIRQLQHAIYLQALRP